MGTNVLLGLDPERIAEVPALLAEARRAAARAAALGRARRRADRRRAQRLTARNVNEDGDPSPRSMSRVIP